MRPGLHLIADDLGTEGWLVGLAAMPDWAWDWILFTRWLKAWTVAA